MTELWEILVPTEHRSNGRPIRTRFHRVWDAKVRDITGGLSISPVVKGHWVCHAEGGKVYKERMIPVRIACSRAQLDMVLEITKAHYDQLQVMAIKISTEVIFYE